MKLEFSKHMPSMIYGVGDKCRRPGGSGIAAKHVRTERRRRARGLPVSVSENPTWPRYRNVISGSKKLPAIKIYTERWDGHMVKLEEGVCVEKRWTR